LASVVIILEMQHPGGDAFTRRRLLFGWSRYEETPQQLAIELSPDGKRYERLTVKASCTRTAASTSTAVTPACSCPARSP
jgi:hypothetical protein